MATPADRQPAFILHRRAFRETSAIVDFLSRDHGRVSGVARGVKGARRRTLHVEPFTEVAVTWRGRGQLVNVLRSELVAANHLTGDALFAGLYVNELLVKTLSQDEPVTALFRRYRETLASLTQGAELEPALRTFERHLLEELGYGLAFDIDISNGRPIDHHRAYGVVAGEGFRELGHGAEGTARRRAPLVLTGRQIAAIGAGDYRDNTVRQAAKRIFRHALELRFSGRRLASRSLFAARALADAV